MILYRQKTTRETHRMPNHIFINRETTSDNISVFYDEPAFVVVADRDDLSAIQLLDEAAKPGIYILLGDNGHCYVGQASGAIFTRLKNHVLNKEWWNKVVFFGRDDQHLSKAQLDFLERQLIERAQSTHQVLDNSTQGNHSYIDKLSRFSALALLSKVDSVLNDIVNLDVFDSGSAEVLPQSHDKQNVIVTFGENRYVGGSYREVFIMIVLEIMTSSLSDQIATMITIDKPNTIKIIGTAARVSGKGTKLTRPIAGTSYHLYVNFSKAALAQQLAKIAKKVNRQIQFDCW